MGFLGQRMCTLSVLRDATQKMTNLKQFTTLNSKSAYGLAYTQTSLIGIIYFLSLIINEHFFLPLLAICISCYGLCLPIFFFLIMKA